MRPTLLTLLLACGPKAPPPSPPSAPPPTEVPAPPASPAPASGRVAPAPATQAPLAPMVSATNPPPPPSAGEDAVPPHMRAPVEPQLPPVSFPAEPVAEGYIDGPSSFPVVEAQRAVFEACWRAAKVDNPALGPTILVKIDVNPKGKVAQGSVVSDPRGELGLESCVLRKVMTLSFPPPRGGGVGIIRYPFTFTP